ncbi:hypothetical protein B0H14DRAFT_2568204 [Mycena olivaceomarginata]|nr:hypothetical protein B0H14DRAFT_2568204 [Mycena olivaceomarginata]
MSLRTSASPLRHLPHPTAAPLQALWVMVLAALIPSLLQLKAAIAKAFLRSRVVPHIPSCHKTRTLGCTDVNWESGHTPAPLTTLSQCCHVQYGAFPHWPTSTLSGALAATQAHCTAPTHLQQYRKPGFSRDISDIGPSQKKCKETVARDHMVGLEENGVQSHMTKGPRTPSGWENVVVEAKECNAAEVSERALDGHLTCTFSESWPSVICAPRLRAILRRQNSSKPLAIPAEVEGCRIVKAVNTRVVGQTKTKRSQE